MNNSSIFKSGQLAFVAIYTDGESRSFQNQTFYPCMILEVHQLTSNNCHIYPSYTILYEGKVESFMETDLYSLAQVIG